MEQGTVITPYHSHIHSKAADTAHTPVSLLSLQSKTERTMYLLSNTLAPRHYHTIALPLRLHHSSPPPRYVYHCWKCRPVMRRPSAPRTGCNCHLHVFPAHTCNLSLYPTRPAGERRTPDKFTDVSASCPS